MKLRPTTESSEMPSVLNRYLDTDKYQGEIRPLAKAIFYNRFGKHDLFLSDADLDKCGWAGDEALEKVPIEEALPPPVVKEIKEWLGRD